MNDKEFGDLMLSMMQNPDHVAKTLFDALELCERSKKGCQKVVENWDKMKENPANMEKQLLTAIKVNMGLSDTLMKILILQLAYVGGEQYSSDAAKTLNKMGRGGEAVREMFRQKLGKNSPL